MSRNVQYQKPGSNHILHTNFASIRDFKGLDGVLAVHLDIAEERRGKRSSRFTPSLRVTTMASPWMVEEQTHPERSACLCMAADENDDENDSGVTQTSPEGHTDQVKSDIAKSTSTSEVSHQSLGNILAESAECGDESPPSYDDAIRGSPWTGPSSQDQDQKTDAKEESHIAHSEIQSGVPSSTKTRGDIRALFDGLTGQGSGASSSNGGTAFTEPTEPKLAIEFVRWKRDLRPDTSAGFSNKDGKSTEVSDGLCDLHQSLEEWKTQVTALASPSMVSPNITAEPSEEDIVRARFVDLTFDLASSARPTGAFGIVVTTSSKSFDKMQKSRWNKLPGVLKLSGNYNDSDDDMPLEPGEYSGYWSD